MRPNHCSTIFTRFSWIAGVSLTLALGVVGKQLDTLRTWESIDGRSIRATLIAVYPASKTAKMSRADGLIFTTDWHSLSSSDQALLVEEANKQQTQPESISAELLQQTKQLELADKFELKNVPMVQQHGNFCVPASATMIAGFHGVETDQDEVAQLSSEESTSNQGTYPSDMLLAMEKLGFGGQSLLWEDESTFYETALPAIRRALVETGPIYISFKAGVFGTMGHGCVIVGYNHRREELEFHNPWGNVFKKQYKEVAAQGHGVVFIHPPTPAPVATDTFVQALQQQIPRFDGNFISLSKRLERAGQKFELAWCSRRDARNDKHFAVDTARSDGRKILELAFERNPAVLIPYSPKGQTVAYYFVTRPPEGGANFLVREIAEQGWSAPELKTLGSLTREWPTAFKFQDSKETVWELPMIELREQSQ
jgi:hypothetical protein